MSKTSQPLVDWQPLTIELRDPQSPIRRFLDDRFTAGLPEVQRRYRDRPCELAVPPVAAAQANPGTIGTAADWLLRFLLHPQPDLHLAMEGVFASTAMGISTLAAFAQIAQGLDIPRSVIADDIRALGGLTDVREPARFTGPVPGSTTDRPTLPVPAGRLPC